MSLILLGILNSQAAAAGGGAGYDLLETQTLTGSAASVTFTGLGSYTDYKHLQLRFVSRGSSSVLPYARLNSDTGSNYASHRLNGDGSSAGSDAFTSISNLYLGIQASSFVDANTFGVGVVDFLDFSNSNKNTTIRVLSGIAGNYNNIFLNSGLWNNTNAVTQIQLFPDAGDFIAGSRFSLYGVR